MDTTPTTASTPAELATAAPVELLLDRYLPVFGFTAREHLVVDAEPLTTWRALERLDLMQVHTPLLDAAMAVRTLPTAVATRLGRRPPPPPPPARLPMVGGGRGADGLASLPGWLPLGTAPGREVALGAVGRFWRPDIEWYDVTAMTPEGFAAFDQPGWGRIAAGISLQSYGRTRTLASYEARTALGDAASARRFRRYWTLVQPFVGHVLRATLQALRAETERTAGARTIDLTGTA